MKRFSIALLWLSVCVVTVVSVQALEGVSESTKQLSAEEGEPSGRGGVLLRGFQVHPSPEAEEAIRRAHEIGEELERRSSPTAVAQRGWRVVFPVLAAVCMVVLLTMGGIVWLSRARRRHS